MGDRYFVSVRCPGCKHNEEDVYYAPTCGFTDWVCPNCKLRVDLATYTGISREDASNLSEITQLVNEVDKAWHDEGGEG